MTRIATIRQIRTAIPVFLGSLVGSTHYPWSTANLDYFRTLSFTDSEISCITSALHLGRLLAAIFEILLLKNVGRKTHLLASALLMMVGTLAAVWLETVPALVIVRFVIGFGYGMGDMSANIYIGETVSKKYRGLFTSIPVITFSVGVMAMYAAPIYFSYRSILLLVLAANVIAFAWTFDLVESPYFLSTVDQWERAKSSLVWLHDYTDKEAAAELQIISADRDSVDGKRAPNVLDLFRNFRKPEIYKSMCVVVSLGVVFAALSSVTTCFATLIFPRLDSISASGFAIAFTAPRTLVSCAASLAIDKCGRRVLLVWGLAFQTLAQASIALLYYLHDDYGVEFVNFPWLIFGCVTVTFLVYQFTCTLPFAAIRSEIFPTNFKSIAVGVNAVGIALFTAAFGYSFLPIMGAYGLYLNFLIFSVCSLVGLLVVAALLPETRKKSLVEIQAILRKS